MEHHHSPSQSRYPSAGSISAHDSSGEHTPPTIIATPGLEYPSIVRGGFPGTSHNYFPSQEYSHNHGQYMNGGSTGLSLDSFDLDVMKRALDLSGLPNNPINGTVPQIDPSSSFDNVPTKRHRQNSPPTSSARAPGPTFRVSAPFPNAPGFPNNMSSGGPAVQMPPSPIHLGGSLNAQGQSAIGSPSAPSSPYLPLGMPMGVGMGFGGFPYMQYPGTPVVSPSMNPNTMTGNYGPAAAAAAAAAAGNITGRTVYVGSLPSEASVDELLNLVRFGPIENVRIIPEKSCVFISFLDGSTAAAFHADATVKKLALHGTELKIGWGKASLVPPAVAQAVLNHQATRNVFIGNLSETTNEQDLRNVCQAFGPIDQVKIVRDKNIGFVHFLSIATAIKVVAELPLQPGWADKRVNYGKDRCAYVPKAQQAAVQAAQAQAAAAIASQHAQMPGSAFPGFSPMTPSFGGFSTPQSGFPSPLFPGAGFPQPGLQMAETNQAGNRNIYLGNIHPDTTTEELCNNIRGGTLASIRHIKEKNIAFVTFADPQSAMQFYTNANVIGLTINHRRLKVGWGKHSGPLSPVQLQAIQSGATRNVYIGQIEDLSVLTEEKLRQDFAEYGEIEMINFLQERRAAFVNFTSVTAAIKAVEGVRLRDDYASYRIAYGKDRCANPPRANQAERATMMAPRAPPAVNGNANGAAHQETVDQSAAADVSASSANEQDEGESYE